MMLGLTLGGIVEILVLTNVLKNTYWRLIWAIGILMIGLFVLHPQPTPYATDLHRAYGITGIIAALITALALFLGPKQKWLAYGWPVLFIFISFLWCFFYSTPDAMISQHGFPLQTRLALPIGTLIAWAILFTEIILVILALAISLQNLKSMTKKRRRPEK